MATEKELEAEVGRLRGEIVELKTQLARARQDQEAFQRWFDRYRAVREETDELYIAARRRLGAVKRRLTS